MVTLMHFRNNVDKLKIRPAISLTVDLGDIVADDLDFVGCECVLVYTDDDTSSFATACDDQSMIDTELRPPPETC
jgi:hypothetical protein